jgi:protein-S-isoprenylcysteine O-methyltransferase Ste14
VRDWLTKRTRGRLWLLVVLAALWFLLLIQALAMSSPSQWSVPGAVYWLVVQLALVGAAVATWHRRRDARSQNVS